MSTFSEQSADAYAVLARVRSVAETFPSSVYSLGMFGSAATNPAAHDIDALLVMSDPERTEWRPDSDALRKRVAGDYAPTAPRDPRFRQLSQMLEQNIEEHFRIPVWHGIGPIDRGFPKHRLHLQGPTGRQSWISYAEQFPVQAWSIRLGFTPIVGPKPHAGAISVTNVREYVDTMKDRLTESPTRSYARKSVQGLCVVAGHQSSRYGSCRSFSIESGLLRSEDVPQDFSESSAGEVGLRALEALSKLIESAAHDGVILRASSANGHS